MQPPNQRQHHSISSTKCNGSQLVDNQPSYNGGPTNMVMGKIPCDRRSQKWVGVTPPVALGDVSSYLLMVQKIPSPTTGERMVLKKTRWILIMVDLTKTRPSPQLGEIPPDSRPTWCFGLQIWKTLPKHRVSVGCFCCMGMSNFPKDQKIKRSKQPLSWHNISVAGYVKLACFQGYPQHQHHQSTWKLLVSFGF